MKFSLATFLLVGARSNANAACSETTIIHDNFECVAEYPAVHVLAGQTCNKPDANGYFCQSDGGTLGGRMGGGFIYTDSSTGDYLTDMQNDKMILQVHTESSYGALVSVPIERDGMCCQAAHTATPNDACCQCN